MVVDVVVLIVSFFITSVIFNERGAITIRRWDYICSGSGGGGSISGTTDSGARASFVPPSLPTGFYPLELSERYIYKIEKAEKNYL